MQIKEALTQKEFVDAYNHGPHSCLSKGSDNAKIWTQVLGSKHFSPALWYYHSPVHRLFYAHRGGKIIARVIVCVGRLGGTLGRIYTRQMAANQSLVDYIGLYIPLKAGHGLLSSFDFEIDGIELDDEHKELCHSFGFIIDKEKLYAAPMPFIDDDYKMMWIKFEEGKFKFSSKAREGYTAYEADIYTGLILSTISGGYECAICGTKKQYMDGHIQAKDGHMFCQSSCAREAGYVQAINKFLERQWIKSTDAVRDMFDVTTERFTTPHAAMAAGHMKHFLDGWCSSLDDTKLTKTIGIPVLKRKGQKLIECMLSRRAARNPDHEWIEAIGFQYRNDTYPFVIKEKRG